MTVEEMQNRWAEKNYGLKDVTRVGFEVYNGMGGCPTCGPEPAYVEVYVTYDGGKHKSFETTFVTGLIESIVAVALNEPGS